MQLMYRLVGMAIHLEFLLICLRPGKFIASYPSDLDAGGWSIFNYIYTVEPVLVATCIRQQPGSLLWPLPVVLNDPFTFSSY